MEGVTVRLHHAKVHLEDCANCEHSDTQLDLIEREIELRGPLSQEQRGRLMAIADRCPIHRTLTSRIEIRTRAV